VTGPWNGRGRRRPTILDVAMEAGVSRGTVSRVLNGGRWVSDDAEVAVQAAIKKTGYRINPHARSLVTSRTSSVAFLLTEPQELLFEDPNFSTLMQAASPALAQQDYSLILIMASTKAEQRRALEFIAAGHVDGVLLVSTHSSNQGLVAGIHASKIPAVACGAPIGFETTMSYVSIDDHDASVRIVEHLKAGGRGRIATITGPLDMPGGRRRLAGYRDALGAELDASLIANGDYSAASGAAAMTELLAVDPDLDAVFTANDRMAEGALSVLHRSGRRVPEDVAIAGFDDSPIATRCNPPLTTMRQPFDRISTEMVRLLIAEINGEGIATVILPAELVVREST
jgi:DNA-binding LacI/PurR family transcriptional regulator